MVEIEIRLQRGALVNNDGHDHRMRKVELGLTRCRGRAIWAGSTGDAALEIERLKKKR